MKIIQKVKNKIFKKKLAKLGFDMEDEENERIATGFNNAGLGGNHFVKCMAVGVQTHKLQIICEAISNRKDAGRFLQLKPIVIQCHSCSDNMALKKGVEFAGETIYFKSIDDIIEHLTTCKGIICDCGKKRPYLENCKKCKIKWNESAHHYLGYRKDYLFTDKQKKQIEKYKKQFVNVGEGEK